MMHDLQIKDILMYAVLILAAIISSGSGQDANCDFQTSIQPGQRYWVQKTFRAGNTCRWIATSPVGYVTTIECTVVNITQTTGCRGDRLLISKSGDPQLNGADAYCGRGTVTTVSDGPQISMGLIAEANSPGGNIVCAFYARAVSTPPTSNCACGYGKRNRIVGGTETQINEYPMMAGLVDIGMAKIFCGGAIISERYVVTAAHCIRNKNLNETAVVVGEHDVTIGDSPATRVYRISQFVIHPRFSLNTYDYDVGLVRTTISIMFSGLVGPVCLPWRFADTDYTGAKVTALGWGTVTPGGPVSDVLLKVNLDVISQSSCRAKVPALTSRQVCTYTPDKDACQYDSGGPMLYTDQSSGLLYIFTIVSTGYFCAEYGQPAINVRVTNSEILQWIDNNTPDTQFCRK